MQADWCGAVAGASVKQSQPWNEGKRAALSSHPGVCAPAFFIHLYVWLVSSTGDILVLDIKIISLGLWQ